MAYWLVKEEPAHYAWRDLERDGRTEWDGVHSALALRHLKTMHRGDRAIFYHTGRERACVGIVEVTSAPHPDPHDVRGSWSVEVRAVRALHRPIPLSEVRADPALAGFDLVRLGRLSVMPVSDDQWARLLAHENSSVWRPAPPTAASARSGPRTVRRRRSAAARHTR